MQLKTMEQKVLESVDKEKKYSINIKMIKLEFSYALDMQYRSNVF